MRHRKQRGQLSVSPSHKRAMGRNFVAALFEHGSIETTVAKAKAFRPLAEKLITIARRGNASKAEGTAAGMAAHLHAVRRVAALMPHKPSVYKLFHDVAPAAADRPGGYTRILRLSSSRLGDRAPLALLQLVDSVSVSEAADGEETDE